MVKKKGKKKKRRGKKEKEEEKKKDSLDLEAIITRLFHTGGVRGAEPPAIFFSHF